MRILLDAPQHFEHVCVISRTFEALGVTHCYVHDPNRLIRSRYGKSRTRKLKKVSAGAFFRISFETVADPGGLLRRLPGRKLATVPDQGATSLTRFRFHLDDVLIFGSEGRGVSPKILGLCDERVTIPQQGVTQSLNLGVAVGVFLFEAHRQGIIPDTGTPA